MEELAILAPGLLGSSVARAAHHRGVTRHIRIWARRPEVRFRLRGEPWCSAAPDSLAETVAQANLVVIASPVDQILPLVAEIAPHLPEGVLVTDVGSVKGEIVRLAAGKLGSRATFVGAHPMAGSEKTGWEHGSETLFVGRTCFVTPGRDTPEDALAAVARFWTDLGAEVATIDPDKHDEIVAHISHLPQVLASTLCAFLAGHDPAWRNYAGGGLRDTTRIAESDPALWRTILEQNRDEVLVALRRYQDELQAFQAALANRDFFEVKAKLERGRSYRQQFRPLK